MKSYLIMVLGLAMLFVLLSVNTASAHGPYHRYRAPYAVGGVSVDVVGPYGGRVIYRGSWDPLYRAPFYRAPAYHYYHGHGPYYRPFVRPYFW